ncbi:MAG TPA: M1 family metallopeptidase [Acidimicrobiales bacterium]|jgi:puromycin-sensitive aminopeptidase|nr:M1 family metallopeptidase [Acidimicrobiales bacterium]
MTGSGAATPSFRLPDTSRPRRYDITLTPDLDDAVFGGEERIEIEVVAPTSLIVLNSVEIDLTAASAAVGWASQGAQPDEPIELSWSYDSELEMVNLAAPAALAPGRYTLELSFTGILNDKLCGFYRSQFTDGDGVERSIATTQFEETDARRAFPCYDEPAAKAVFGITLDVPAGLFAVSNSPELSRTPLPGGRDRVRFRDTMIMSTYLVAFVVGPLEATEPLDVDGVDVRVIHVPGKAHLTAPALECAAHALGFFSGYFDIAYPGDKLDLVAIPDFAAGAMENLGCVTFREAILLADPESTSRSELERLAEVVEHEIAHMWFGDLVTMKWWNGIWLNEAFATFMALCCQDDYRPEWQAFVGFSRGKGAALAVDGLHATRPIEFPVHHPEDAAAMFDLLTYEKGASVLWMLEQYLGRDRFRDGVRRYLKANVYDNTETTDLWDAIEQEASDEPVRELMDTWIFQGGYPLIEATSSGVGSTVMLRQRPFTYLPPAARTESSIGDGWLIPLIYGSAPNLHRILLGREPIEIEIDGPPLLNSGGGGFFRFQYHPTLLASLLDHLDEISTGERLNIVADTWAVAVAGRGPLSSFLSIVDRLAEEENPHVWSVIIGAAGLLDLVAEPEGRPALRAFVQRLLTPVLDRVGWFATDDEGEQIPLLRSSLVSALGTIADDDQVVREARRLFAIDVAGAPGLVADLAAAVLGVVAAHATREEFDAIIDRYRHPRNPMDEARYLSALGGVRDPGFAAEVRELCRVEVRSQNAPYVLGSMLRNRYVGVATFSFITEHFDELAARFPDNSIPRMFDGVSGLVAPSGEGRSRLLLEVQSFLRSHITGARSRAIEQSLERLEVNLQFASAVGGELPQLLASTARRDARSPH